MSADITDADIFAAALRAAKSVRSGTPEVVASAVLRAVRPLIDEQRTERMRSWQPRRLRGMRFVSQAEMGEVK